MYICVLHTCPHVHRISYGSLSFTRSHTILAHSILHLLNCRWTLQSTAVRYSMWGSWRYGGCIVLCAACYGHDLCLVLAKVHHPLQRSRLTRNHTAVLSSTANVAALLLQTMSTTVVV